MNQDFKELFKILNAEKVKYLVVGAYAFTFYAEPRYTKDLDIWIEPEMENAHKVWNALVKFGAPLQDIQVKDFTDEKLIYQIGIEPNRIDIIMGIAGVQFYKAWKNRILSKYEDEQISLISLEDLIIAKKASGRSQDLLDVESLENILRKRSS